MFSLIDLDFYKAKPEVMAARKAIKTIPKNASVGVQSAFPHLTSREKVYNVPRFVESADNWPEYVILSTELDYWPFNSTQEVMDFKTNLIDNHYYQEIFNQDKVYVIKRQNPSPK
jgi:uncharacterized membrane protein